MPESGLWSHVDVILCSVPFSMVEKETEGLKVSSELIFSGLRLSRKQGWVQACGGRNNLCEAV